MSGFRIALVPTCIQIYLTSAYANKFSKRYKYEIHVKFRDIQTMALLLHPVIFYHITMRNYHIAAIIGKTIHKIRKINIDGGQLSFFIQ